MKVSAIEVKCRKCGKHDYMILDWSEFRLPNGWLYRTRSWRDDDEPEDIQIVCSKECADSL